MPGIESAVNINLPLNICIKVNNENNVISLKCHGFQTELFMPSVIDGRLTIINVVPTRRCKCISTSHIVPKNPNFANQSKSNSSSFYLSSLIPSQEFRTSTPEKRNVKRKSVSAANTGSAINKDNLNQLKNVSPAVTLTIGRARQLTPQISPNRVTISNVVVESQTAVGNARHLEAQSYPIRNIPYLSTQELQDLKARSAVLQINHIAVENLNDLELQDQVLPSPEPLRATKNKSSHILQNLSAFPHIHDVSTAPSSPPPPNSSASLKYLSSVDNLQTPPPPRKSVKNILNNACDTPTFSSPPDTQWRGKVLTPKRTYSRQHYSPNQSMSAASSSASVCESLTEGIKAQKTHKQVILDKKKKQNHLDKKLSLSPRSFKQQQQSDRPIVALERELRQEYWKRYVENKRKDPFDLFTTPTTASKCLSTKLIATFHLRCLNKGSSTYPKYKKLAKVEPRSKHSGEVATELPTTATEVILESRAAGSETSNFTLIEVYDEASDSHGELV